VPDVDHDADEHQALDPERVTTPTSITTPTLFSDVEPDVTRSR